MGIDWESEAGTVEATDEQLKRVSNLVERQLELERTVAEVEASLKALKNDLTQVSEVDLPVAMDEANLEMFQTRSGRRVTVSEKLYMSIPKSRKEACARWLMNNGLGSLVREDVIVRFERGQEERVAALQEVLVDAGFDDWTVAESMNTTAIKGAFNERMGEGQDVPLDMFGGYLRRAAKID